MVCSGGHLGCSKWRRRIIFPSWFRPGFVLPSWFRPTVLFLGNLGFCCKVLELITDSNCNEVIKTYMSWIRVLAKCKRTIIFYVFLSVMGEDRCPRPKPPLLHGLPKISVLVSSWFRPSVLVEALSMHSHKTSVEKKNEIFFSSWFRTIRPGEPSFRPGGMT